MAEAKIGGRYVSLVNLNGGEVSAKRAQSDLVGELFCTACEDRFTVDDTFGSQLFRDNQFPSHDIPPQRTTTESYLLEYPNEVGEPLHYFVIGLLLRFSLYQISKGTRPVLGPRFSEYAKLYVDETLTIEQARMFVIKYPELGMVHSTPAFTKYKKRNAVTIAFCGHLFMTITDKQGHEGLRELDLINYNSCRILVDVTKSSPFIQSIAKTAELTSAEYQKRYGRS